MLTAGGSYHVALRPSGYSFLAAKRANDSIVLPQRTLHSVPNYGESTVCQFPTSIAIPLELRLRDRHLLTTITTIQLGVVRIYK